jgi:hypothetical protein
MNWLDNRNIAQEGAFVAALSQINLDHSERGADRRRLAGGALASYGSNMKKLLIAFILLSGCSGQEEGGGNMASPTRQTQASRPEAPQGRPGAAITTLTGLYEGGGEVSEKASSAWSTPRERRPASAWSPGVRMTIAARAAARPSAKAIGWRSG